MSDEDGQYWFDKDTNRALTVNPFGIALYEIIERTDTQATGRHIGVTGSDEAAQEWVHGGALPDDLIVIHAEP